ncbi:hypothetical protein [Flavobacterium sp.]|uniref:hypothetical protein n=1 Tax=Flavobacterium sp. TaxID=239 RepID=UPI00286A1185|nr:hypothetical protein [Flavobacterium sp.]
MKKIIFNFTFLLFSLFIFAQKSESKCNYNDSIFKLFPNEMTFDIEKYKSYNNKGEVVILDNDKYYYTIQIDSTEISFVKLNKELKIDKTIYYYPNGKIKRNYFYFKPYEESTSSKIAVSKRFNLDGSIQEIYDYDYGYKVCYDEIIPIVKKIIGAKKIKKYELQFSVGRSDLSRFPDGKAKWFISVTGNKKYHEKIKPSNSYDYVIDGVTGKFLGILKPQWVP